MAVDNILDQMKSDIAHKICLNLRNPLDARKRIHFTSRAVKLVSIIFYEKDVDVITLHSYLLQIAYMKGCFSKKAYVTLVDVITYFLLNGHISGDAATEAASRFDISRDSEHGEVDEMMRIIGSISRE